MAEWTFLTNHPHAMLCLEGDPGARLRDVAAAVGITERATRRIIAELEGAGYLARVREGRRNRYTIDGSAHLRHRLEGGSRVGDLPDAPAHTESEAGARRPAGARRAVA